MLKLLFLFILFSRALVAADYNCAILKFDEGCLITPSVQKVDEQILIYFRGHLDGSGHIPAKDRISSAKQATKFYGLEKLADSKGISIFVTGSSHIRISQSDLDILKPSSTSEVLLASHSGGFVGLHKSLLTYSQKIHSIYMLDNFYFGESLTHKIKDFLNKGAKCSGFFTEHNRNRFQTRFKSIIEDKNCPVEKSGSHNGHVFPFLNKKI